MTDRRDPEEEELRELLADLESTLVELRKELDEGRRDRPQIPRGLPGGGRPAPRPPRFRDVLRFTEEYTIPTLISVLEANIRLLRLGGAALRALDPERSTVPGAGDRDGAVDRALDAGREFSTERLRSGLEELNDALAGTDAPDPAARELLSEAEELSAEIQQRLRAARAGADGMAEEKSRREGVGRVGEPANEDGAVHIDVQDGNGAESDQRESGSVADDDKTPTPDVDAELDSIREEVRGSTDEIEADENEDDDDAGGTEPANDADGEDADGTSLE